MSLKVSKPFDNRLERRVKSTIIQQNIYNLLLY